MNPFLPSFIKVLCLLVGSQYGAQSLAANPIDPGWYADPEIRIFDNQFWIYPTYSAGETTPDLPVSLTESQRQQRSQPGIWSPFLKQTFLNASCLGQTLDRPDPQRRPAHRPDGIQR